MTQASARNTDDIVEGAATLAQQLEQQRSAIQQRERNTRTQQGQGLGRLVATKSVGTNETQLTTVAHKAPVRLLPLYRKQSSHLYQQQQQQQHDEPTATTAKNASPSSPAAICYLSNYGGGLLPGDRLVHHVTVEQQATLAVLTQGSNRIYKSATDTFSESLFHATLHPHSRLIVAPDPVAPFGQSLFRQVNRIHLPEEQELEESTASKQVFSSSPAASLCMVDWISAGRVANGEQWRQNLLETTTEITIGDKVVLQDAMRLDARHRGGLVGWGEEANKENGTSQETPWQCNAYATVYLYGKDPVDHEVLHRCRALQTALMQQTTRTRQSRSKSNTVPSDALEDTTKVHEFLESRLSQHRVLMSMAEVPVDDSSASSSIHVIRIAAMSNEDIYKSLQFCLQPLATATGCGIYRERIRAVQSAPVEYLPYHPESSRKPISDTTTSSAPINLQSPKHWSLLLLADTALPTGSFAHSSGLEAAAQLGLVTDQASVETFVRAAVASQVQQTAPVIRRVHKILGMHDPHTRSEDIFEALLKLNQQYHVSVVSNPPACQASLIQGKSMIGVVHKWMQDLVKSHEQRTMENEKAQQALNFLAFWKDFEQTCNPKSMHIVTVLAIVTHFLGFSSDEALLLLGYSMARDMVSAAVRLNLVGPMSSVAVLDTAQEAAAAAIIPNRAENNNGGDDEILIPNSAPVLDTIHPNHELLRVRLFRS